MWNLKKWYKWDFPGGTVNGNLPANAGDTEPIPGLGGLHMPLSNQAHAPQLRNLCPSCLNVKLKYFCSIHRKHLDPVLM